MNFILNVVASIIAAFLISLIGFVIKLNIDGISPLSFFRTLRRITVSKIKYFYNDRKYLVKYLGTTGEFLSLAERSVMYIGFWMSSSIDNSDFLKILKAKTSKSVEFSACFPDPDSPLMNYYSAFFEKPKEELIMKINSNINSIKQVKEELPPNKKNNIRMFIHEYPITASAFIIDKGDKKCKVLIDHKLPNSERFFSYGFEIYGYKNKFCENIINSYKEILDGAKEI